MESGMFVRQAYPPRRAACGVHLSSVQPFPHGVCARTFLESRVAFSKRVVGEDELAPRPPFTFITK